MSQSLILAIDQGGQSSRVGIFTRQGQLLHSFAAACATRHIKDDVSGQEWIEQDPLEILRGIQQGLESVQQFLGRDLQNIIAAGFSGQGSSLLCWHKTTGIPLTPVLSWQDVRASALCEHLELSQEQVQVKTGLRISPHYGASKIRWCLDNVASVQDAAREENLCVGPIVSFVFWHLLHKAFVVDYGHAQRTLLWNLQSQTWDEDLLRAFGIDISFLPLCLAHDAHFGNLTIGNHSIPFSASARDQGASLFAKGAPVVNSVYVNLGTGAFVQSLNNSLSSPNGILVSPILLSRGKDSKKIYAWEATVNGAASAMEFLESEIGVPVTSRLMQHALRLEVSRVEPNNDLYLLNAVGGLSAPYWRTDLQSQFAPNLNNEEKILAWLESIIFQICVNIKLMQTKPAQSIYLSGGLSNLDGLCQSLANISGIKVLRYENKDASLQGIACMASGNIAEWKSRDSLDIFNPQPSAGIQYRFSVWQEKMQQWLTG